jgi:hypothetical protein
LLLFQVSPSPIFENKSLAGYISHHPRAVIDSVINLELFGHWKGYNELKSKDEEGNIDIFINKEPDDKNNNENPAFELDLDNDSNDVILPKKGITVSRKKCEKEFLDKKVKKEIKDLFYTQDEEDEDETLRKYESYSKEEDDDVICIPMNRSFKYYEGEDVNLPRERF